MPVLQILQIETVLIVAIKQIIGFLISDTLNLFKNLCHELNIMEIIISG